MFTMILGTKEASFFLIPFNTYKESPRRGPPRERHAHHSACTKLLSLRFSSLPLLFCASCLLVSYALTLLRFPLFIFLLSIFVLQFCMRASFCFCHYAVLLFNCVLFYHTCGSAHRSTRAQSFSFYDVF